MSNATPQIPDKLFFKIGEAAEIVKVEPYVLRFWETQFKELAPKKAGNNQRKYTKREINTLLAIKQLLYEEKFTIPGAKRKLKEMKAAGNIKVEKSSVQIRQEFKEALLEIKEKILEIQGQIPLDSKNPNISIDA
jgi:DNA-binding transcriptional MerR regulator